MTTVRQTSPVDASVERLRELSTMLAKRIDELATRLNPVRRAYPVGADIRDDDADKPNRSALVTQLDELAEMSRDRITAIEEILSSLDL